MLLGATLNRFLDADTALAIHNSGEVVESNRLPLIVLVSLHALSDTKLAQEFPSYLERILLRQSSLRQRVFEYRTA